MSRPRMFDNLKAPPEPDGVTMQLFWPAELHDLRHEARRFFEAMTYKLRKNAHKKTPDEADLPRLFELLKGEIAELELAVKEGNSIEVLLESSDSANFCMLIAAVAMAKGVRDVDGQR